MQIRPLPGMHLNLFGAEAEACQSEPLTESCLESADWLRQVDVLATDLFVGSQYALPKPGPMAAKDSQAVDHKAEVNIRGEAVENDLPSPSTPAIPSYSRRLI